MHRVHRQAVVRYPPEAMFELVRDVASYPDFLSWCRHAAVEEECEARQRAALHIGLPGITQSFTTLNRLKPHQRIDMQLERGPFKRLTGTWRFAPAALAETEAGCRVSLEMEFAFSNFMLDATLGRGFARIADHLVEDFCVRAGAVYA